MDLLGRFSAWLDSLHKPLEDSACQPPADLAGPVKVTLWGRRFKLQLEIPASERANDPEVASAAAREIPGAGEEDPTDRPVPQAAGDLWKSPVGLHDIPHQQTGPRERRPYYAAAFWDALDPTEREALRSMASWRTFAAGARIMEEGERADHVMVILGGQVKICVHENDTEHVLAVRGLGQLVGERGALEVSVRSATVVALDMIWALVVQTKDFAAFLSAHPRLLGIVQNQLDQRGTGDPAAPERYAGRPAGTEAEEAIVATRGEHGGRTGHSRRRSRQLDGENCTVFLTDVVGFGAHARTDGDRLLIREVLFRTTQAVVEGMADAQTEDRGDGFLTVVPPDISTAKVISQLLKELPAAIALHNSTQRESARFKLRLAVNVGPVATDIAGVSGEAIIVAARLVESPHFKEAIVGSAATLGLIASPFVYETVIRHGHDQGYVASYSPVPVEVKESRTMAWMKLFDAPLPASLVPDSEAPNSIRGLLAAFEQPHEPRKYSVIQWLLKVSSQVRPWMPGREPQYYRIVTEPHPLGQGESQLRAVRVLAVA